MNFVCRTILGCFLSVYPTKIYGKENLPTGKALMICNHFRAIDCGYVASIYNRDIKFVAKKELFKNKLLGKIIKDFGAIPIDRDNPDMSSILTIMKQLKLEHKVCIFPEGTRNKSGTNKLQDFKGGYIVFALKTKSPIVPIMMLNRGKPFRRTKMIIGKPIYLTEYYNKKLSENELEEINQNIRKIMMEQQQILSDIKKKK